MAGRGRGRGCIIRWMGEGTPSEIPGSDPFPSVLYPNEPDGFTPMCEHRGDVVPGKAGGGSLQNGISGWWWHRGSDEANMSIGDNGSGEQSDPDYLTIKYPALMEDGIAPAFYLGWDDANFGQTVTDFGLREMYQSIWLRIRGNASSPTANDGTNYENHPVYTKLWYNACKYAGTPRFPGDPSQNNNILITLNGGTTYDTSWVISFRAEQTTADGLSPFGGPIPNNVPPNIDATKYVTLGNWHHIEIYSKMNTLTDSPATDDGVYKLWVDEHLTAHRTDIRFGSASYPYGFRQFRCDPVWGGNNVVNKTARDDYIDFGHIYCSGIQY